MKLRLVLHLVWVALFLSSLASCTAGRYGGRFFRRVLQSDIQDSPVFARGVTGFHLVDAASGREICGVWADKNFTPASNTKILTLATCLAVLGDSLPGLEIVDRLLGGDEIRGGQEWVQAYFVTGTGDPTFLHPKFNAWQPVFQYLKKTGVILLADPGKGPFSRFGAGWSWDDYSDDYSPERSALPVFGNVVTLRREGERWEAYPRRFQDSLADMGAVAGTRPRVRRAEFSNQMEIQVPEDRHAGFEAGVPVFQAGKLALTLLADTLGWPLPEMQTPWEVPAKRSYLYSVPVDTVYRRMMHQSDNFIAEQLLLMCAGVKLDTLDEARIIRWAQDSLFAGFPQPPRWVDGSGLSRYNLVSPRFLTTVLRKIYLEQPRERLFSLFPAGGVSGTLENWYAGPEGTPFVFAKTGSMGGVHCLSGYLLAKSGKVLIFSFMHNNFIGSNNAWKTEMQRILRAIRERG
ncbi:MAG: D-alanyl-D-alanine carboxypeptidase [Saprospirales bacterium]|nr:D-alanyl-D-alanine carboxypeptidase [Saprospirales bacterium]